METDHGASILATGNRAVLFRAWCRIFFLGLPPLISWTVALYLLAAFWSNAYAANECLEVRWQSFAITNPYTDAVALCETYMNAETGSITGTYCLSDLAFTCPYGPDLTPPISSGDVVIRGYQVYDGASHRKGIALYDSDGNTPSCPEGQELVPLGAGAFNCVEDLACTDSYLDDVVFSQYHTTNPGLCDVGDYVAFNEANVCTYSESAASYCEATHYGTMTYLEALPDVFAESGGITFSENPCTGPGTVTGYEYPVSCEPPPPNCPPGTYSDGVSCVVYDDQDQELPPDPITAERETTTTTTTTTTTNPDGSVTTTSTTTQTYGECPPGEVCTEGFDYEGPGDREAKTFQETFEAYLIDIDNAPIFSVAEGIAAAVPESATCPTFPIPTLDIVGQSYTIDGHCLIADEYESEIRTLMALVWALLGLMILLSA